MAANRNIYGNRSTLERVYAPTNDSGMQILGTSNSQKGKQREILLKVILNARTRKSSNDSTIENHGEGVSNASGKKLLGICEQLDLKILNGFFPRKEKHKYTRRRETKTTKLSNKLHYNKTKI